MHGVKRGSTGSNASAAQSALEVRAGICNAKRTASGALVLSAALTLTACGSITNYLPHFLAPFRPDVQQGNVITNEMVEQLRSGMTRDQVKFMLGTPLLTDGFHPDEWDYLYYLKPGAGPAQRRNLVIYFKDNRLDHFLSDPMPAESMADNLILGRKPPSKDSNPAPRQSLPEPPPAPGPIGPPGPPGRLGP